MHECLYMMIHCYLVIRVFFGWFGFCGWFWVLLIENYAVIFWKEAIELVNLNLLVWVFTKNLKCYERQAFSNLLPYTIRNCSKLHSSFLLSLSWHVPYRERAVHDLAQEPGVLPLSFSVTCRFWLVGHKVRQILM